MMKQVQPSELASKINRIGILIGVVAPPVLLLVIWLLRTTIEPETKAGLLPAIYVIVFVALTLPLLARFVMRPIVINAKNLVASMAKTREPASKHVLSSCMVIFGMTAAPAVHGLVTYLMGAGFLYFGILTAVSLLSYIWLKPKGGEIENLLREVDRLQQASGRPSA